MTSLDPAGHIKIAVVDYAKSYEFYRRLFDVLGYKGIKDSGSGAGWVTPAGFGIYIAGAEIAAKPLAHGSPGLHHLCFKAHSVDAVNKVYDTLVKSDVKIFEGPAQYPQYTASYYAVFFADPDGSKLEVAFY
ncbi:MAG: VOC family protein [Candidatus Saccharimonadales bacterium]